MTDASTDGLRIARSLRVILRAVEKRRSDSADDSEIARICMTSLDSNGIL